MPTDDERLAVARRLRRSRSEWSGMGWRLWLGPKFCAVVLSDGNRDELEDAAHLLADLIEPPTRCPHYHSGRHYCSVHEDMALIDRDALLALADEMTVEKGDIWGWSSRIREALGVER